MASNGEMEQIRAGINTTKKNDEDESKKKKKKKEKMRTRPFSLFIYFIKTPKIGEIHVQYMNNINITW